MINEKKKNHQFFFSFKKIKKIIVKRKSTGRLEIQGGVRKSDGTMFISKISSLTCPRVVPRHSLVRNVSSLPPLTAAFNTKQSVQFRFNWLQNKTGLFGIPELKNSDGWSELRERCFVNCESLVEEVTSDERSGM